MSKALLRKMSEAQTYDEWKEAAIAYDKHYGLQRWKENELSRRYDYQAIRQRLDYSRQSRRDGQFITVSQGKIRHETNDCRLC